MHVKLGDHVYFDVLTRDAAGQLTDADAAPTWDIFETNTDVPVVSGVMAKRGAALDGNYVGDFEADPLAGFAAGAWYVLRVLATVGGVDDGTIVWGGPFRVIEYDSDDNQAAVAGVAVDVTNTEAKVDTLILGTNVTSVDGIAVTSPNDFKNPRSPR